LQYFQKAIRHNSNLSVAHYQLALIYEKKGDYSKSLEFFRRVTELNHTNVLASYKVGVQHFKEGAYEHALRYFLGAIAYGGKVYPDDTLYYLAQIYDRKKEYGLAIQRYLHFVWVRPEHAAEVYPRIAEICHLFKRDDCVTAINSIRDAGRPDLSDLLEQSFRAAQSIDP